MEWNVIVHVQLIQPVYFRDLGEKYLYSYSSISVPPQHLLTHHFSIPFTQWESIIPAQWNGTKSSLAVQIVLLTSMSHWFPGSGDISIDFSKVEMADCGVVGFVLYVLLSRAAWRLK